jgi:hypothetical protein
LAYSRKKRARKTPKTVANSEECLHKHCQQWLEKSGLWSRLLIFHVPNERKGGIGAVMHFKRLGVRTGVADYLLFAPARAVAVELKDDKGTQDRDQEVFQAKWEACGNAYFVVRTLKEFQGVVHAVALFA